ncbi:MAG: four helix bundle protein [Candidatus Absconditabacterales bacterium]
MEYLKTFEKLYIRQESKELFLEIYKIVNEKTFKDYFYKDQILRATLSISNNIAEGKERGTNKEFIRFLYIARGSCGEVRNMIIIAKELLLIDNKVTELIMDKLIKISSGIKRLIDTRY